MGSIFEDQSGSIDVAVVGAGFAGLYALHRLRTQGFRAKVLEAGDGVGGTWYWNTYPGARCDVQSVVYCYTFDETLYREWTWSERYATQPEILRYLNFVADRLDLRKDIIFGAFVSRATFDERANCWTLTTRTGQTLSAAHVIMATGSLSVPRLPDIKGVTEYCGKRYHTSEWPQQGVDFAGMRVAVIGTGSSGVQAIPLIAKRAQHLTVFQRTPCFVVPARNAPMPLPENRQLRENFSQYRDQLRRGEIAGSGDLVVCEHLPPKKPRTLEVSSDERQAILEARWQVGGLAVAHAFADILTDVDANLVLANFFRAKIREIVRDSRTAARLTPGYLFGTKRVCVGTDYLETFNRQNVELVDVSEEPIWEFTPKGLRTSQKEYEFDTLVLATGFDALTGALARIEIKGIDGVSLQETWKRRGPQCYLGVSIAGFPNLFTVNGPGSPGILGNVVVGIEQHVEWIVDLLCYARARVSTRIEADLRIQEEWFDHVAQAAEDTLLTKGTNYWTKEVPGRSKVFIPYVKGIGVYREICEKIAADRYKGFRFLPS